jgi:hypothetical protein
VHRVQPPPAAFEADEFDGRLTFECRYEHRACGDRRRASLRGRCRAGVGRGRGRGAAMRMLRRQRVSRQVDAADTSAWIYAGSIR